MDSLNGSDRLRPCLKEDAPFALLHIPHSSTYIPPDIRRTLAVSDAELEAELLRMTDRYTDELFGGDLPLTTSVVYPVAVWLWTLNDFSMILSNLWLNLEWGPSIPEDPMVWSCGNLHPSQKERT